LQNRPFRRLIATVLTRVIRQPGPARVDLITIDQLSVNVDYHHFTTIDGVKNLIGQFLIRSIRVVRSDSPAEFIME
jgi:hypothetical protein